MFQCRVETNFNSLKCNNMDSCFSSTLSMLLCVETPFNKGLYHSPSVHHFPISCFVFQHPHNLCKSFACLDNTSSSCFVFFVIISLHWKLFLLFEDQDRELVILTIICQCHILQARLEELVNAYSNSFFFKVINAVLNNVLIGPVINSLASSEWVYGNLGLSLKRYRIDLLIKVAKHFMISSACKPNPLRVLIEYWQGFTFWK